MVRNYFIGIGFIIVVFSLFFFLFQGKGKEDTPTSMVTQQSLIAGRFEKGEFAPTFQTIDFAGDAVSFSDFSGKAVILDFWAAWCPFCVEEMPELEAIHQEAGDDVVILGIHRTDSGESIEKAQQFADKQGVTYRLLQDTTGVLYKAAAGGLRAMPVAVFIDSNGIVRDVKFGPKTREEIRAYVDKIK